MKENENLQAALKREFKEETNLDIKVGKIIGRRIEETFDRTKIIVSYEVTKAMGKIKLNNENTEYGWFAKPPPCSIYDYQEYIERAESTRRPDLGFFVPTAETILTLE